jgi:hypothetical protein
VNGRKVLLLVASPRGAASVSNSLGEHLLGLLEGRGMAIKKLLLHPALEDEKRMGELLAAVDACALLVIAFPLYVDHLPAPLIELLRQVADRRQGRTGEARQSLAALVQCGFPETAHCRPAGDIVRLFAAQAGFRFLGCLAFGMGGAVGNRPLAGVGGIVRHQVRALGEAAIYLAEDKELPAEVIAGMGRPLMPRWFYRLAANWGWRRQAKKAGTSRSLKDTPYSGDRKES